MNKMPIIGGALVGGALLVGSGCSGKHNVDHDSKLELEQKSKGSTKFEIGYNVVDKDNLLKILCNTDGKEVYEKDFNTIEYSGDFTVDGLEPGNEYNVTCNLASVDGVTGLEENTTKTITAETLGIDSPVKIGVQVLSIDEENNTVKLQLDVNDVDGIHTIIIEDQEGNNVKEFDLTEENITAFNKEINLDLVDGGYKITVITVNGENYSDDEKEVNIESGEKEEFSIDENNEKDIEVGELPEGTGYKIVGEEIPFYIKDGKIYAKNSFDYENKSQYDFYVIYKTSDGIYKIENISVNINDINENNAPVAQNISVQTFEDKNITINLNASDLDGDQLSYSITSNPYNGILTTTGGKTITYIPNKGFTGTDSFEYTVSDGKGGESTATITVEVKEALDTEKPVITLNGDSKITLTEGDDYIEQGAEATDNKDGNITDKIEINGEVDTNKVGTYEIIYTVTDEAGNESSIIRTVEVVAAASWNTDELDQEVTDNQSGTRNNLPRFDDSDEKMIIENILTFLNNSDNFELIQDGIDDGNGNRIYPLEIKNGNLVLKGDGMNNLADQEYTFKLKSGNAIYEKTIYLNNN